MLLLSVRTTPDCVPLFPSAQLHAFAVRFLQVLRMHYCSLRTPDQTVDFNMATSQRWVGSLH